MKVKFNKFLMEESPKTTVMNSNLDKYINHRRNKFTDVPFRFKGEWFSVSGKYETDEDDINILSLEVEHDIEGELLSDKDKEKVKEILSQLIWQHFLNLKDNHYDV